MPNVTGEWGPACLPTARPPARPPATCRLAPRGAPNGHQSRNNARIHPPTLAGPAPPDAQGPGLYLRIFKNTAYSKSPHWSPIHRFKGSQWHNSIMREVEPKLPAGPAAGVCALVSVCDFLCLFPHRPWKLQPYLTSFPTWTAGSPTSSPTAPPTSACEGHTVLAGPTVKLHLTRCAVGHVLDPEPSKGVLFSRLHCHMMHGWSPLVAGLESSVQYCSG